MGPTGCSGENAPRRRIRTGLGAAAAPRQGGKVPCRARTCGGGGEGVDQAAHPVRSVRRRAANPASTMSLRSPASRTRPCRASSTATPTSVPRHVKVLAAMAEIDYTPSSIARALATNRSRRIGVIVDSPLEFGPGSTMRGIEQAARDMRLRCRGRHRRRRPRRRVRPSEAPGRRSALRHRTALFDPPRSPPVRARPADHAPHDRTRERPADRRGRPVRGGRCMPSTTSSRSATAVSCTSRDRPTGATHA